MTLGKTQGVTAVIENTAGQGSNVGNEFWHLKHIIDRVEDKDMHLSEELPVLDLPKLGILPGQYEAVEKAVKELERQGIAVIIKK